MESWGFQLLLLPLPFPGAVQVSCKPPPAAISKSREATHFGVAHDLGTKEQAHQQDSHSGEAGILDSGPARETEVRGRGGGARRRAGWVTAVQGRSSQVTSRASPRSSLLSGGSEVPGPGQPGPASARGRMGARRGDSVRSRCTAGQPGQPGKGEGEPARAGSAAHAARALREACTHRRLRREGRGAGSTRTG